MSNLNKRFNELRRLFREAIRYEGGESVEFDKDNPFIIAFEQKCKMLGTNLQCIGFRPESQKKGK
jgi:hypothetical protein